MHSPPRPGKAGRKDGTMITVETDRIYSIYTRKNRRVKWQYADYNGRWETPEKAIEIAKHRIHGNFEYRIEEIGGTTVETGIIER